MIRELIDNLDDSERQRLMIGFENEFAQHVELPEGKFVGVNITGDAKFNILEQTGVWSYGELIECQP